MAEHYLYQDGLQTERLITRFLQEADLEIFIPFMADKECTRFIPYYGIDNPTERATHIIEKQLLRYQENRYGLQLLLDKKTQAPIGMCGLLLQDVDGRPELEIGYHLLKENWGKGYAIEAAKAFKQYGFAHTQTDSIVSMIDVDNLRSQRVARQNGMLPEPQRRWLEYDIFIFRITRAEWQVTNRGAV